MLHAQRFTTGQGTLQLWRRGTGPVALLLHDLATSHASFAGLVPYLVRERHVCAIDLLGHGGSSRDPAYLSVARQAAAVIEILIELGFRDACLVGHGFGGSVAIRVGALAPDRIRKLVLIAAGTYRDPVPLRLRLLRHAPLWLACGLLGRATRRRIAAALSGRTAPSEALEGFRTFAEWAALGRTYRQYSSSESLAEMEELVEHYLTLPTLAIWGTEDRTASIQSARATLQRRRNVRLIEIAGASHVPHEEAPGIVAELILEFLK